MYKVIITLPGAKGESIGRYKTKAEALEAEAQLAKLFKGEAVVTVKNIGRGVP